jgi:iron complex outermembrane recepter protein
MRLNPIVRTLSVAFGGLAILAQPAFAQQQPETQKLDRVEITGSAIKRTNQEGAVPVEVITRRDIQRTGATTVAELIKNVASMDIDDQGEQNGNSPSGSGSSNVQMRGLSERNVLVLLNGRRLPVNALHDGSGAGAAVDVNSIPISALERIEILKDGGSAIYGADAVAGVINFITRKNYNGIEATLQYGISGQSDGQEVPVRLIAGFGDYDKDRFNFFGSFDLFKRDAIKRADREITKSADWRGRYDVGVDGRSTFAPQGNIVNANTGALLGGSLVPCAPELQRATGAGLDPHCRYDFNSSILNAVNGADRTSGLLIGSFKISDSIRAFGEVVISQSKDEFLAHPVPDFFGTSASPTGLVRGRFLQGGPRTANRKSDMSSLTLGAEGSTAKYDWDISLNQGTSKVSLRDSNYFNADLFDEALSSTNPNIFIDPTITTNPQANVDRLKVTPVRNGKSVSTTLNAKLSGQILQLANGPLAFAVGGSMGNEKLTDNPDALSQAGKVYGSIQQSGVSASRKSTAAFVEFSIPIIKNLETQIALRWDSYKDKGNLQTLDANGNPVFTPVSNTYSKMSPKVAAKYNLGSVALRGSYSESFLAPSLKQQFGAQEEGAESTNNPVICAAFGVPVAQCNNFAYDEISGSNPTLKPESGKTYNFGIIIEPTRGLSIGLDLFNIQKSDEINQPSSETAAASGNISTVGGPKVLVGSLNFARTTVKGVDVDTRYRFTSGWGTWSIRNNTTYYAKIATQLDPTDAPANFAGTWSQPRWRNTLGITLEQGAWSGTVTHKSVSSFYDSATAPVAPGTRRVSSFDETDISASYTGIKGLNLYGGIRNILDNEPPYSSTSTLNQYGAQGYPWIYSPRGRFFYVGGTYTFK